VNPAPLALPSVFRYFPPAVAKTYVVTFRSHNDDRPSKFIVLADNMKSAINVAWEHGGADFRLRFDKSTHKPGLGPEFGSPPAWPGFRPLRVSRFHRESNSVLSLVLISADGRSLVAAERGQFVVLRLRPETGAISWPSQLLGSMELRVQES
jgi:hypothetical protein